MFSGSGLKIGRVAGIPVFVNWSWFLVFFLFAVTLGSQFSAQNPQWTPVQYWTLGVVASLLIFASVLFHELGHSTVALHYKIPVVSITLFIFGGMAAIAHEPDRPLKQFNIAIAGPAASLLLAGAFYAIALPFSPNSMIGAGAIWLAYINGVLAVFNLVPGFPLDGGRILQAIAWAKTKNFNRGTQLASRSGQLLSYLMILLGIVIAVESHYWLSGLWLVFLGWFLLTAAQQSSAQVAIRRVLDGLSAADVMSSELPLIDRTLSVEDYLHEVLRTGRRCHLVLGNNEMVGMITLHAVRSIPRDEWANTSIQGAMLPKNQIQWVQADDPALKVIERMQKIDVNQMPVLRDGNVVGMVSRDAVLRVIQTRLQLERLAHA
jgi:Zn-dependent protease/CBS domain-containing protein